MAWRRLFPTSAFFLAVRLSGAAAGFLTQFLLARLHQFTFEQRAEVTIRDVDHRWRVDHVDVIAGTDRRKLLSVERDDLGRSV